MFNSTTIEDQYNYACKQIKDFPNIPTNYINISDVIKAYYCLADYFLDDSSGEIEKMCVEIRSYHLLGSAVGRQFVEYNGRKKYETPIEICATLFYGLVTDHPFVDGNKRTALLILIYQLQCFGYYPKVGIKEFEKLVLIVAERAFSTKLNNIYYKFRTELPIDAEIKTIAYQLRQFTERTYRSFHSDITMKDFCYALKEADVTYTLENSKIKFQRAKKSSIFSKRKPAYTINFYGWTRPIEPRVARDVFDNLNLTEDYPNYQSLLDNYREPLYSLIKDYEIPLKRLKDK